MLLQRIVVQSCQTPLELIGFQPVPREVAMRNTMSTVAKSYYEGSDPVLAYCLGNSHIHPAMESLQKATLNVPRSMMLGAPECLLMNQTFIRSKGATKVLDVGMFTGASALASALAIEKKV